MEFDEKIVSTKDRNSLPDNNRSTQQLATTPPLEQPHRKEIATGILEIVLGLACIIVYLVVAIHDISAPSSGWGQGLSIIMLAWLIIFGILAIALGVKNIKNKPPHSFKKQILIILVSFILCLIIPFIGPILGIILFTKVLL